jgi:cathepsin X
MHGDNLAIESDCDWGVPVVTLDEPTPAVNEVSNKPNAVANTAFWTGPTVRSQPGPKKSVVTTPLPHTYITAVPDAYDVRNINGLDWTTVNLNQHIPQ